MKTKQQPIYLATAIYWGLVGLLVLGVTLYGLLTGNLFVPSAGVIFNICSLIFPSIVIGAMLHVSCAIIKNKPVKKKVSVPLLIIFCVYMFLFFNMVPQPVYSIVIQNTLVVVGIFFVAGIVKYKNFPNKKVEPTRKTPVEVGKV